jgi:hypothetical protein
LPVVERLVLALFAWLAGSGWWTVRDAIDYLLTWGPSYGAAASLAFRATAVLLLGAAAARLLRTVRQRPRVPAHAACVRVDGAGLQADGALVVARANVVDVHVATDADLGFALVVTTRSGATVRVPLREEGTARQLAKALGADDPRALVFEGVTDARWRQTRAAVLSVVGVLAVLGGSLFLAEMSDNVEYWSWFRGWDAEKPYTFAWWLSMVCLLHVFPTGLALAAALAPVARRLRQGRVRISGGVIDTGDHLVPVDAVALATAGDESDATLALRDGRRVRIHFGAERPLLERDLFLSRVREIGAAADGVSMYPATETSGVRVAVKPDEAEATVEEVDDLEPERAEAAKAPGERRRG